MLTIQYLEDSPELAQLSPAAVTEKLRQAHALLPFNRLLIGWHLPPPLLAACRNEAERLGVKLLRWHPLLTGDAVFLPRPEWQVLGAGCEPVPGFRNLPEFTFVCPNHPAVRAAISRRLTGLLHEGVYAGFFLDRIRFPSPAANPPRDLGCFCEHCRKAAAAQNLDLEEVRSTILRLAGSPTGRLALVQTLLGGGEDSPQAGILRAFLNFRAGSITAFAESLCIPLRQAGMEIGLDCFSPGLMPMVGQDLARLGALADWVKVMTYAHTLGPAGLPFELLALFDYLSSTTALPPAGILDSLGAALNLPLPARRAALQASGLSSAALAAEVRRGVQACPAPVLAGVELVEIPGVARLNNDRVQSDLAAIQSAGAAGLALSWDLWYIPTERLQLVGRFLQDKS